MTISNKYLLDFVTESLMIEGINRLPSEKELEATDKFIHLPDLVLSNLTELVSVLAPHARLRDKTGLDVRVGNFHPMAGGERVFSEIKLLLKKCSRNEPTYSPFKVHIIYETLHPFTDGNGRSGRALWLWKMIRDKEPIGLSFLHHYYYQSFPFIRNDFINYTADLPDISRVNAGSRVNAVRTQPFQEIPPPSRSEELPRSEELHSRLMQPHSHSQFQPQPYISRPGWSTEVDSTQTPCGNPHRRIDSEPIF